MSAPRLALLQAGHCRHPEHVVLRNWKFAPMRFPALFAVIEHPREGVVLFDTGYSRRFLEVTQRFPESLYRRMTPPSIEPEETALAQLTARGIGPGDVRAVVISHFHGDHVAALGDFPRAEFLHTPEAWEGFCRWRGFGAVRRGYLRALVPDDFERRSKPLEPDRLQSLPSEMEPFEQGIDLFGDGHVHAIPLPGHAHGQIGLWVREGENRAGARDLLLVADACWTDRSFRERRHPHLVTRLLFSDSRAYRKTFDQIADLHQRRPEVCIVPSHCERTLEELGGWP